MDLENFFDSGGNCMKSKGTWSRSKIFLRCNVRLKTKGSYGAPKERVDRCYKFLVHFQFRLDTKGKISRYATK
jgi:hypothetical protein